MNVDPFLKEWNYSVDRGGELSTEVGLWRSAAVQKFMWTAPFLKRSVFARSSSSRPWKQSRFHDCRGWWIFTTPQKRREGSQPPRRTDHGRHADKCLSTSTECSGSIIHEAEAIESPKGKQKRLVLGFFSPPTPQLIALLQSLG